LNDQRPPPREDNTAPAREITAAVERFEKAVQDLVSATAGHLGDRATNLIDETSKRLEAEVRLKRASSDPGAERRQSRRRRRHRSRHRLAHRAERRSRRTGRLAADRSNKKIAGVCGAVAGYFGFETWAVRMGALTGLIFIPQVVFPAYWIIYFIMDKSTLRGEPRTTADGRQYQAEAQSEEFRTMQSKPAQRPQEFVPRRTLRNTTADLAQAELRLRRLESFVTSDQYELHKELAVIERDAGPRGAT